MLFLFIIFVLGLSVISTFWGGDQNSHSSMFVFLGILLLTLPIDIVIISDIFLSKITILSNILKVVAFIISLFFIIVTVVVFQDLRKDNFNNQNNYELKKPDESHDNSND